MTTPSPPIVAPVTMFAPTPTASFQGQSGRLYQASGGTASVDRSDIGGAVQAGWTLTLSKTPAGNTVVLLGDSVMNYSQERISVLASAVTGNGSITTVNSNFQPVIDGAICNIGCPGAPFDQQQVVCSAIDNTHFSFPSTLVGNPPSPFEGTNSFLLSDRGFITWANRHMGQRLNILNNACIGGNTGAQMIARIPTQVLPYLPAYCIIMQGVNDLGQSPGFILNNLKQMIALLQPAGITPIVLTILPLSASYGGGGASFTVPTGVLLAANQLIKNYCAANNILCIDTFQAMVDPSQSNGAGVSTYYNAAGSDFVHPICQASRLVGAQIAAALASLFPPVPLYGNNAADTFGTYPSNFNLLDQAPYASSGGTVSGTGSSGTLPTNFALNLVSGSGTCVCSVPARTVAADGDTIGNNVQLVITASAAAEYSLTLSPDITTRLVPGGKYQLRFKIRLSGTTGSKLYNVVNQWLIDDSSSVRVGYVGGGFQDATVQNDSQWADGPYNGQPALDYVSAVFTCPSWANSGCVPELYFYFSAAGSAVTINIGRCTLMRLS